MAEIPHGTHKEIGSEAEATALSSATSAARHRDARIDALKGIAIALVVFGHAMSYQIGSPAERTPLGIAIWSVHMQLFAFASGLVTRGVEESPGRFVLRRSRQLLVPYVCWTAIAALVADASLGSVLRAEQAALFFPRTSLWFLHTLFLCCLILAATAPFGKRYVIAAALLLPLTQGLPIRPDMFALYDLVVLFPYFVAGYFLGRRGLRLERVKPFFVVSCGMLYAFMYWLQTTPGWPSAPAWYLGLRDVMHSVGLPGAVLLLIYSNYVWGAAGVAAIYLAAPALRGRVEALFAVLGRNTLGIYALQAWALQWIARSGVRAALPLSILALVATTLASVVLARVPYVREALLGCMRRRPRVEPAGVPGAPAAADEAI